MIYPESFEHKTGFSEVRSLLSERCMSSLGRERVDAMTFLTDAAQVNELLTQVREYRRLAQTDEDIPLQFFIDMRPALARLRLEGTYMETEELFDLRRSLDTTDKLKTFIVSRREGDGDAHPYPALLRLTDGIATFGGAVRHIDGIIDKSGTLRDDASPELMTIRSDIARTEGSLARTLYNILRSAQSEGVVDRDTAPAMRDGRLVIPVAPAMKRKIRGIVHDESASGKTVYIEPAEVVEANNRIRELRNDERREVIRILKATAAFLRPSAEAMAASYRLQADIDFVRCKALLADDLGCTEPVTDSSPVIDWTVAEHPLLKLSLRRQGKSVVPLDIQLDDDRMLIISGPNAGGKSVCLKTVGLVQYMLQCGVPVPMGENSRTGLFGSILIDIGDEQSIENDLSTYSSHLLNMKVMMRHADSRTLILIDELGTGTEPQIGGAIAESVLEQLCSKGAYGVITTHYHNLKHFAETHDGVTNGAMLYDRAAMRPLFQLAIGQPGSSFAIDIARTIGLPEEVIRKASDIVGSEYIQSDRYLQDIARDKRYWEGKRKEIHRREKRLQETIERYEQETDSLRRERRDILAKARQEAADLLSESNRRIEQTIRRIKEAAAEREDTRRIRAELEAFRNESLTAKDDDTISRKAEQIKRRHERRHERRRRATATATDSNTDTPATVSREPLEVGSTVRIKGLTAIGTIENINGTQATVIFGDKRTKLPTERLERAQGEERQQTQQPLPTATRRMREDIDKRRMAFKPDIDVRGMRGDEALTAVTYFLDDATLVGIDRVRILHGTGTGALRQMIRQYLATVPSVGDFRDEHVQFGGAGITVVNLK